MFTNGFLKDLAGVGRDRLMFRSATFVRVDAACRTLRSSSMSPLIGVEVIAGSIPVGFRYWQMLGISSANSSTAHFAEIAWALAPVWFSRAVAARAVRFARTYLKIA